MNIRKKSLAFLMSLLMILSTFTVAIPQLKAFAADEQTDSVYFTSEYAKPGSELYVAFKAMGSDAYSYKWYVDGNVVNCTANHYTPTKYDLEKFIKAEVYAGEEKLGEASIFCSRLPVIYINTENSQAITSKEDYIKADISIQGNDEYNSATTTLYSGVTEIKGHGNSTWQRFPKKAYKLKLDKKTDLFSMGKNKHWLLIANYIDESCMRNQSSIEIANILGAQTNSAVWVDLVLNGECVGNYQLYEQTRVGESRVNIFDWEDAAGDIAKAIKKKEKLTSDDQDAIEDILVEDLSWMTSDEVTYNEKTYKISDYYDIPSINGGYLMEMDSNYDEISKFTTTHGAPIMFKKPEYIYTNSEAMTLVQSYVQDFEDAIYSSDKCITKDGKKVSYTELCDIDSLVSYWLTNEVLISEIGYRSTYFSKDVDGKLVFGPVWDFDFSADSVNPWSALNENAWISKDSAWGERLWFPQIMEDPYFAVKAGELYRQKAAELRAMVEDGGTLEVWYNQIYESAINNSSIWSYSRGFEEDYQAFKTWLEARLDWMDEQFETDETSMQSLGVKTSDDLSLSLTANDLLQIGDNSYAAAKNANEAFLVSVSIENQNCTAFNYYINGEFAGKVDLTNSASSFSVDKSLLNSDLSANVITVWLLDNSGNLLSMQALVLRITDLSSYVKLTFDNNGTQTESYVLAGTKVIMPKVDTAENTIFSAWINENKVYKAGDSITVNSNTVITAAYSVCKNGSLTHSLKEQNGDLVCSKCSKKLISEKEYINIKNTTVSVSNRYSVQYTGSEVAPTITVNYNSAALTEGVDYNITYKNNIDLGFATYTITGIEEAGYTGSFSMVYGIVARNMSKVKVKADQSVYYQTGKAIVPTFTLTSAGRTLEKDVDYTVKLSNNVKVGTATAVFTGIGNYTGTKEVTFEIQAKPTIASAVLSQSSFVYDGKVKKPTVTVKGSDGKTLKSSTDYTVTYAGGRKAVGTYTVKITGKGSYSGTKTLSFTIVPGKATGLKASSQTTTSLKLSWTKTAGATGYRVYSYNASTKKYTKLANVTATSYTVKNLKAGTKYVYVVKPVAKVGSDVYLGTISAKLTAVTKPAAPTIKLAVQSGNVTVSYGKVTGATGYEIYYKAKGGTYSKLTATEKTSFTKALTKGKTYVFRVRAYTNYSGKKLYSAYSAEKSIAVK